MKQKIILCLFIIALTAFISGCGKNEKTNNENDLIKGNTVKETEKKEENEEKKEETNSIIIDDEIIEFDDEDNTPYEEGNVNVEKIINCDGCVFSYFSETKNIGSTLSNEEYTKDVSKLKTSDGKQRHNFFGFVLSENKISKAYSCILKDNKIYCIEGSTNGAYHNNNIAILNQIFKSNQCKTISNGNTYTCTDRNYNGDTRTDGYTSLHYETSCTIYGSNARTGELICH